MPGPSQAWVRSDVPKLDKPGTSRGDIPTRLYTRSASNRLCPPTRAVRATQHRGLGLQDCGQGHRAYMQFQHGCLQCRRHSVASMKTASTGLRKRGFLSCQDCCQSEIFRWRGDRFVLITRFDAVRLLRSFPRVICASRRRIPNCASGCCRLDICSQGTSRPIASCRTGFCSYMCMPPSLCKVPENLRPKP